MTVEIEKATYTVPEAAALLGISRNKAYRDVAAGHLPVIRLGRTVRVPKATIDKLLGKAASDLDQFCDRLIAGEKGDYQEALMTLQKLLDQFHVEAHRIAALYDADEISAALKRAQKRYYGEDHPN